MASPSDPTPSPIRPPTIPVWRELFWLVLVAAVIRALRLVFFVPVVEIEGSEYGRIAENLLAGTGYVGLIPGPELMLPPLYPATMAGVMAVTGMDSVFAGRLVSVVASLVTVAGIYLIGRRVAGLAVARYAGLLAALLPALVLTGTAVFSEGLQIAWLTLATWALIPAATERRAGPAALCGAFLGLAYLTRIESLVVVPGFLAVILLGRRLSGRESPTGSAATALAACVGGLIVTGAAYPLYLANATDDLGYAGKSARVFMTIERFGDGMSQAEANFALSPEGEELGAWLSPNAPYDGPGAVSIALRSPGSILAYVAGNAAQVGWMLLNGKGVCSLLFIPLIFLALARKGRSPASRAVDLALLWILISTFGTASIYKVVVRYTTPIALPVCLWGATGLCLLARRRFPARAAVVVLGGVVILALSTSRGFLTGFGEFNEASATSLEVKEVGDALRAHSQGGVIMGPDSRLPFYAGRKWTWQPLPVASSWESLRDHARDRGVTHLALHLTRLERPGPWLAPARLPPELSRVAGSANGHRIVLALER